MLDAKFDIYGGRTSAMFLVGDARSVENPNKRKLALNFSTMHKTYIVQLFRCVKIP